MTPEKKTTGDGANSMADIAKAKATGKSAKPKAATKPTSKQPAAKSAPKATPEAKAEPRAAHQKVPETTSVELAEKVRQELLKIEAVAHDRAEAKEKVDAFLPLLDDVRAFAEAKHADGKYMTADDIDDMIFDARRAITFVPSIAGKESIGRANVAKSVVETKDILLKAVFGERHDTLVSRKDFEAGAAVPACPEFEAVDTAEKTD